MRLSKVGLRVGTTLLCTGFFASGAMAAPLAPDATADVSIVTAAPLPPLNSNPLGFQPFTQAVGELGLVSYAYDEASQCIGMAFDGGSGVSGATVLQLMRTPTPKLAKKFGVSFLLLLCQRGGVVNATLLDPDGIKDSVKANKSRKKIKADGSIVSADFAAPGQIAKVSLADERQAGGAKFSIVIAEVILSVGQDGVVRLVVTDRKNNKLITFDRTVGAYSADLSAAAKEVLRDTYQRTIDDIGAPEFIMSK